MSEYKFKCLVLNKWFFSLTWIKRKIKPNVFNTNAFLNRVYTIQVRIITVWDSRNVGLWILHNTYCPIPSWRNRTIRVLSSRLQHTRWSLLAKEEMQDSVCTWVRYSGLQQPYLSLRNYCSNTRERAARPYLCSCPPGPGRSGLPTRSRRRGDCLHRLETRQNRPRRRWAQVSGLTSCLGIRRDHTVRSYVHIPLELGVRLQYDLQCTH